MSEVPIRELRNHGGAVAERVLAGEDITVTHAGTPVMRLIPLPKTALTAEALLARWKHVSPVDVSALRADLDSVIDPGL